MEEDATHAIANSVISPAKVKLVASSDDITLRQQQQQHSRTPDAKPIAAYFENAQWYDELTPETLE
jgi:hypothetical protein